MYSKQYLFNGLHLEDTIPSKVINELLMGGVEALIYGVSICRNDNGWGRTLIVQAMIEMSLGRLDGKNKLDKTAIPEIKHLIHSTWHHENLKELWLKIKDQLRTFYESSRRYKGQEWEDTPYGTLYSILENMK